jgi:hypothetical protein
VSVAIYLGIILTPRIQGACVERYFWGIRPPEAPPGGWQSAVENPDESPTCKGSVMQVMLQLSGSRLKKLDKG